MKKSDEIAGEPRTVSSWSSCRGESTSVPSASRMPYMVPSASTTTTTVWNIDRVGVGVGDGVAVLSGGGVLVVVGVRLGVVEVTAVGTGVVATCCNVKAGEPKMGAPMSSYRHFGGGFFLGSG